MKSLWEFNVWVNQSIQFEENNIKFQDHNPNTFVYITCSHV